MQSIILVVSDTRADRIKQFNKATSVKYRKVKVGTNLVR